MKGTGESIYVPIAMIIFTGTVVFLYMMIVGNIVSFGGKVASDVDKIRAIEASHMVEFCFTSIESGDSDYISSRILELEKNRNIGEICVIEYPSTLKAQIIDTESGETWEFEDKIENPDHEIWVSIFHEDTKKINMGKIYVKI